MAELAIIIPDAVFIFMPVIDSLKYSRRITFCACGVILPCVMAIFARVSAEYMLPVIPVLVMEVIFLFLLFFFTVNITLGRKLFCFFTAIMLGAFSLLYSIAVMATYEAVNDLWDSTRLLTIESGIASLVVAVIAGCIYFRALAYEIPALLKEERISVIWDFLFLLPLAGLLLIAWMTPIWPRNILVGRSRVILLILLPLIPLVILLIYYLLWWISAKISEEARVQQENTLRVMEAKRYEELRRYMEETRVLRHDFRHHILVMNQLAGSGKIDELLSYLADFGAGAEGNYTSYCANAAVDALASYYTGLAENDGINIDWKLNLPHELPLRESDYCVVLGNLIENALRAVKNLPREKCRISVISSLLSDSIIGISADNPYAGKIVIGENGLPVSVSEGHGIGLASVMNTVRRYGGTMNMTAERGIFSADIVLYCGGEAMYLSKAKS